MISTYPCDRRCAACTTVVQVGTDYRTRRPQPEWLAGGVDGRPGWEELGWLTYEHFLEECSKCGHLAPDLSIEYPGLSRARDAVAEILSLEGHSRFTLRCLVAASLVTDDDPREEGFWILRAAWFDEAEGHHAAARPMRRRAAAALETALYEGYALTGSRLGSALILAECSRVAGDFDRALAHCARAFPRAGNADPEMRRMLAFEVESILGRYTLPATRREAVEAVRTLSPERLRKIGETLNAAREKLPPLTLRSWKNKRSPGRAPEYVGRDYVGEASLFARDYLDDDLLIQLLAGRSAAVWPAVRTHSRFFPSLLAATDHPTPMIRKAALEALYDKSLDFDAEVLHGHDRAVAALAQRLGDDDPQLVRWAGAIAQQVVALDASFTRILIDAARSALPRWHADLPTEGVLERLIASEGTRS